MSLDKIEAREAAERCGETANPIPQHPVDDLVERLTRFIGMVENAHADDDEAFNDYMHDGLPTDVRELLAKVFQLEAAETRARSQPSADAGTHIPRSPEGEWVLVPREPTHAMVEHAWSEIGGDEDAMFASEDSYTDSVEQLIEIYAAMISAAPASLKAAGGGWRDISTAPKDGERVLGWIVYDGHLDWNPDPFQRAAIMCWDEGCTNPGWERKPGWDKQWIGEPSHWMPLPPAPATTSVSEGSLVLGGEGSSVAESARRGPAAPPEPNSLPVGRERS